MIYVASACKDNTVQEVKKLNDPRIRIIEEAERNGKAAAQNIILDLAKGDKIVFTDADVVLEKNAISNLLLKFDKNTAAVIGRTKSYNNEGFFSKLQDFAWSVLHEDRKVQDSKNELFALNGYLFAVDKKKVGDLRLDKNNLVEDALFGFELKKKGYLIKYAADAKVFVKSVQTLNDYFKQKSRVRLGWWQMKKAGMDIKKLRRFSHLKYVFKNPYAFFYLLLELMIWTKTFIDFKRKKFYWESVKSSKI